MEDKQTYCYVTQEKSQDGTGPHDLYHCKECGFTSLKFQGMVGHMQVHTLETFKCDLCKRVFRKPKSYLKHRSKVHKELNPVIPKSRRAPKMHIGDRPDGTMKPPKPYTRRAHTEEATMTGPIPVIAETYTLEDVQPKTMVCDAELMMDPLNQAMEDMLNYEPAFVVEDTVMKHLCTKCNAHHDYDIPGMKHCNLCGGELKQITYKHIRLV